MRFVFAIMAHTGRDQLLSLIDLLLSANPDDQIVLHIDRASELWRKDKGCFAKHKSGRVNIINHPCDVRWGHYSQVSAQQLLLKESLKIGFDYFHLISGSDWPTTKRRQIETEINSYGRLYPVFIRILGESGQNRMMGWWINSNSKRYKNHPYLLKKLVQFQEYLNVAFNKKPRFLFRNRSMYLGSPWIKGSEWFSAPRDIAQIVHDETRPILQSGRLMFTACADEHVIPTILQRHFPQRIVDYKRYIDWSGGGNNPKLLTSDDLKFIQDSGSWFARKFDNSIDDFFQREFTSF